MRALTDMSDCISGRFWYDELGRLVASQNTKQLKSNQYSYTVYDSQSRIVEVGQAERLVSPSVDNQVAYAAFTSWLANSVKTEVTKTYYDKKLEDIAGFRQDNLRTRVASVTYQDEDNALYNGKSYQYATRYSYDPHGNIKSLIQENYQLSDLQQEYKRVDYSYDLVSGLVKEVAYQQGKADQFFHRYAYDADNRITEVHTSADGVLWDQDARYFYYDHGPLARTEIGELSVQGMDYAYTLQGWIKGINSNTLQASRDMGKDSQVGLNAVFAPDEFAYSLGYYDQDYKAINSIGGTHFLAGTDQSGFTGSGASLYNGNISHMVTAIGMLMANGPQAYAYSYDQLNRLRTVTAHADPNVMVVNNWSAASAIQDYSEDYRYDLNGNILRVKRNAAGAESNSSGTGMDDLEYVYENIANEYKRETNKLRRVIDHQTGSSLSEDFKPGQSPDNYDYDEIGNLIADEQEKIASIEWTVSGKIRKVVRKQEAGVGKPDLEFAYDASGNRIMKLEKPRVDGDLLPEHAWTYTYYVRDASGNVMRAYTKKYTEETSGYSVTYKATEAPVYGSSRLGLQTLRAGEALAFRPFTATLSGGVFSGISYTADPTIEPASLSHAYSLRGVKQYELNDHLGNVKVVVSDKRNLTGEADVKSYSDYYAFGMQMPGRYANDGYRYGFNGKENDQETGWQDYGMRMYNPKLGRFFTVDPIARLYPELTPYQFASNRPIDGIDLDGLEYYSIHIKIYVDQNGKAHRSLQKVVSHRDTKNGFGPKGVGIEYVYTHQRHFANSKETYSFSATDFKKNYHGIYVGPNNPLRYDQPADQDGNYSPDYSFAPVDMLDAAAQQHDKDYDAVNAKGINGALFDENTLEADIDLVQRANNVIEMYKEGGMDPVTNEKISKDTYKMAITTKKAFTAIAISKVNMKAGAIFTEEERQEVKTVKDRLQQTKKD